MASFKVSAPGKLILYGEHAVVYGKTALAASLDMRTTLQFEELNADQLNVHLSLPKISLLKNVGVKSIEDYFLGDQGLDNPCKNLYEQVRSFVEGIGYTNSSQKLALEAFFYLFVSIMRDSRFSKVKPFRIHIDTALSVSSGLGSSASFAVCLSACFLHYVNLFEVRPTELGTTQLDRISEYALNCERIMHGNPSGIDNAVCTYGSIIEFRKNDTLRPIDDTKTMRVLLIDTKVARSTKAMVQKLAILKETYPNIYDPILQSIDNVSKEALDVIKKMKALDETGAAASTNELYDKLLLLIDVNQSLLSSCQVSHPAIDEICAEARKHSLRAKLTGAGGGGYVYILLLPETSDETVKEMSDKLTEWGYGITLTNLGGPGVRIES